MNAATSVEALLAQIDLVDPRSGAPPLTLWVPESLTFDGHPLAQDVAMAVVLDAVLAKGFWPDGFVAEGAGRTYIFRFEGS